MSAFTRFYDWIEEQQMGALNRLYALTWISTWLLFAVGCGDAKKIVVTAQDRVDQAIDELKKGNHTLEGIKTILEGLKTNLDNGEYKSQVEEIVGRVGGVAQVSGEAFIDFTRTRVIEDLSNLKRRVLGQALLPREPVLANAQMPAVDFKSSSRTTLTIVGWNLDVAHDSEKKFKAQIHNSRSGERPVKSDFVTYQGQYAITLDTSTSGVPLQHYDKKIVFTDYKPAFEIAIINSDPPSDPPPITVTELYVKVNTTNDDKDREITFVYIVHQDGVGPVHDTAFRAGGGEVWPDPSIREFTIKVDRPFKEGDRMNYQLRVHYESSDGDPRWIGRVSVRGKTSDNRTIDLLAETGDFEMGHHDNGKRSERVTREFKFNR